MAGTVMDNAKNPAKRGRIILRPVGIMHPHTEIIRHLLMFAGLNVYNTIPVVTLH